MIFGVHRVCMEQNEYNNYRNFIKYFVAVKAKLFLIYYCDMWIEINWNKSSIDYKIRLLYNFALKNFKSLDKNPEAT